MGMRSAEELVQLGRFGPKVRLRVDLHGVSVFGPGPERTLIRWEWIEGIEVDEGVLVRSTNSEVSFPPGAFGMAPERLGPLLEEARSLHNRADVIEQLGVGRPTGS